MAKEVPTLHKSMQHVYIATQAVQPGTYVNFEGKGEIVGITFWLILATTAIIRASVLSLPSANMPGSLDCDLMCELNH